MAYCEASDLMTGKIPLPSGLDPQSFVDDAADEIDSQLGFIYETPIEAVNPPLARPVTLLLKRLNRFIATGRLIMAITASSEEDTTHAYANRLLREAGDSLKAIARGDIVLEGAKLLPGENQSTKGAKIINGDISSPVDDFYTGVLGAGQQVFRGFSYGVFADGERPAGG